MGIQLVRADSKRFRQYTRQVLVHSASSATPSPSDIAAAFQTSRERLMRTLVGIFGSAATDALFERSAHLVNDEFAWLADSISAAKVLEVSGIPSAKTADDVLDGLAAILAYDIGLLVALVGEDLILPLVQKAWDPNARPATALGDGNR